MILWSVQDVMLLVFIHLLLLVDVLLLTIAATDVHRRFQLVLVSLIGVIEDTFRQDLLKILNTHQVVDLFSRLNQTFLLFFELFVALLPKVLLAVTIGILDEFSLAKAQFTEGCLRLDFNGIISCR